MKKLYALSFNGRMFYFMGDIQKSEYLKVDYIAKEIAFNLSNPDYESFCNNFILAVNNKLQIEICRISVEHVFRK